VYEPVLLQRGFLVRTPRGRQLTSKAAAHLGRPLPAGSSTQGRLPL
jgi:Holliday junction DNA helicase RuvB